MPSYFLLLRKRAPINKRYNIISILHEIWFKALNTREDNHIYKFSEKPKDLRNCNIVIKKYKIAIQYQLDTYKIIENV